MKGVSARRALRGGRYNQGTTEGLKEGRERLRVTRQNYRYRVGGKLRLMIQTDSAIQIHCPIFSTLPDYWNNNHPPPPPPNNHPEIYVSLLTLALLPVIPRSTVPRTNTVPGVPASHAHPQTPVSALPAAATTCVKQVSATTTGDVITFPKRRRRVRDRAVRGERETQGLLVCQRDMNVGRQK